MPDQPIQVEGLGKRYHIGRRLDRNRTLRDALKTGLLGSVRRAGQLLGSARASTRDETEILWALRGVSFEIRWGEVVGIIGRNGAGKSTLLKILSRITEPTEGRAKIRGRVGSLLEVGTGFHSELTGRENIFLNGAILGMRKAEIASKFDEIVDFSGVERFIDTPVKHYSSGMYVRLAFAVAAYLEPEILIVDEALAVGDASFQRKCISRMGDVARGGRTVLLVTHNMGFISTLTERAMILDEGKLAFFGATPEAIAAYFRASAPQVDEDLRERDRTRGMIPILTAARLTDDSGIGKNEFVAGDDWHLEIEYDTKEDIKLQGAGFNIYAASGALIGGLNSYMLSPPPHGIPPKARVRFRIRDLPLGPGEYFVNISVSTDQKHDQDWIPRAIGFTVANSDPHGNGYVLTPENGPCSFRGSCEIASDIGDPSERRSSSSRGRGVATARGGPE